MPEVNIIRDNAATEVPGVRVLELINQYAAADGEHKAYVLPLMCGTGKSSAISLKIRESIENNEGLLVVTDRKDRLKEYMEPKKNKELADYLKAHLEKVAIMKAENASEIRESHHKCPVLLMTTQRYFRLTVEEIKSFLIWDGGSRGLILIDEKPELFTTYRLSIAELRRLYDAVNVVAPPSMEKADFLSHISKNQTEFFSPYNLATRNKGLEDYCYMAFRDENAFVPNMTPLTYRELYNEEKEFFDGIRDLFTRQRQYKDIPTVFDNYNYLRRHNYIANWWKEKSELIITKSESNAEKITDVGATVIVLDGTADYSADYYNQNFMEKKESDQPDRTIPQLHVRMINAEGTSRQNLEEKKLIAHFSEFIKNEVAEGQKYCLFTFKSIKEAFETDENGDLKKDVLQSYLGNNRGRNDLQDFQVMGQIGILFPPPYRYLDIMLLRDPELRRQLDEEGYQNAEFFDRLMESDEFQDLMYRDVLAEIEQNIFRCPVRDPAYTGEATYYIFYNFAQNQKLKEMIIKRFGNDFYHARWSYVDDPKEALGFYEQLADKTHIGRVLRYLDKLPVGQEFTSKDIKNDEAVKLTSGQFAHVKDNTIVRSLLESYCTNDKKASRRLMTRFRKTFDIREIINQPEK